MGGYLGNDIDDIDDNVAMKEHQISDMGSVKVEQKVVIF